MSQNSAAPQFNFGDYVRILDAEPGVADPKNLVYYDFYRNLTGTVVKAYPDGTVAVSVDMKALPADIRARHIESERVQSERWLNSISEEERNKLSEKQKSFFLRYTILVASKHVVPEIGKAQARVAPARPKVVAPVEEPAERTTSADLDAAEEAYLKSKQV